MTNEKIYEYLQKEDYNTLKQLLLEEMAQQTATRPNIIKAQQKLIKRIIKEMTKQRPDLATLYQCNDTYQVTNGIVALILNDNKTGIAHTPRINQPDLRFLTQTPSSSQLQVNYSAIKLAQKTKEETYTLDNGTLVDPALFTSVYECIEDPVIYNETHYSPIIIKGTNGIGLVMPKRRTP